MIPTPLVSIDEALLHPEIVSYILGTKVLLMSRYTTKCKRLSMNQEIRLTQIYRETWQFMIYLNKMRMLMCY